MGEQCSTGARSRRFERVARPELGRTSPNVAAFKVVAGHVSACAGARGIASVAQGNDKL
jgi:hypothetical protein